MSVNVSMRAFDPTTPIGEVYAFIKQNMDAVYYTTLPGSDAPVEGIPLDMVRQPGGGALILAIWEPS